MAQPWLEDLNPQQRRAVEHGDGPLLIIAGAGTGKTKTLAARVANLIDRGVAPERILLLTFTRRAAAEMISRAQRLVSQESAARVWGGTFHAVANRLLRIYGSALELSPDFTLMDESDAADLMNLVRADLGVERKDRRFPRKETLVKIYSHTVNAQRPMRDVVEEHFPWCSHDVDGIRDIFDGYVERKKRQALLDYDDLLVFWSALCSAPRVGTVVADRFEHILVDEYQDTNTLQSEILRGMQKRWRNITVVGDDAQSIYSFRAATVRNILDFGDHFPGAEVVTLEENYRSTPPILKASNAVMEEAPERYTKELWTRRAAGGRPRLVTCIDEREQCECVSRTILEHFERGMTLRQQAVLFRASHHSAELEIDLARRNIPYHKFGGLRFLEAAHIKDLLAFLRILENPFDELSWFRVLRLWDGVGMRTATRFLEALGVRRTAYPKSSSEGEPTNGARSPLVRLIEQTPAVPASARESLGGFVSLVRNCRGMNGAEEVRPSARNETAALGEAGLSSAGSRIEGNRAAPAESLRRPRDRTIEPALSVQIERVREYYEPLCRRAYENASVRLRDLDQLAQIAKAYSSRERFITELTLDPPTSTSELAGAPYLDDDYLTLSTIHSAKGCEWNVVHVIHAADGNIPSDMALKDAAGLDEERRLLYVAMTRAKDHLYIYAPLRYYHAGSRMGDAHSYAQPSRFLDRGVRCGLFESAASPRSNGSEDTSLDSAPEPYERVGRLWRD